MATTAADSDDQVLDMDAPPRRNARTEQTRRRILATAEQLFAEQGLASVSLNEITRAAGQKNRNAVHYHFGSKEALLQAIFEKHQAPITAARNAALDRIENNPQHTLRDVISALVIPVAERLDDSDGGVAYVRISAQLTATNIQAWFHPEQPALSSVHAWSRITDLCIPFLVELPPAIRDQRIFLIATMMFHALADHSVLREAGEPILNPSALLVHNLIDSLCAVLLGPVSVDTAAILGNLRS